MKFSLLLIGAGAILIAFCGAASADDWFSDDFNDGIIDPAHWTHGGEVTENHGILDLLRQNPGDYIQTVSTYSGDWTLELDSRLSYIVWNDMFHGISIIDDHGVGISFGYSMYGSLYLAVHDDQGGIGYSYGGSNQTGQWQHWVITKTAGSITVTVDGQQPIAVVAPIGENARIHMPGDYEDGDGDPQIGYSDSSVDNFTIRPSDTSGVPESDPMVSTVSWGRVKQVFNR